MEQELTLPENLSSHPVFIGVRVRNQKIPHCLNNYKIKLSKSLKEVKSIPLTHKYMTTHLVDVDKTVN
jgi:hypothetical protein